MTIGEEFTEPLINGELNPSLITSSVFVVTENHIAVTRPLCNGHGNNPIANDPSKIGVSKWVWGEVREQCWLSGPIVAMYFMQFLISMVGIMYVGHLGALPLAAVSLANSFGGITGFTVLMGLASGLETLCGQAYGAKQYHLLGIYLQRAIVILVLSSIPITAIWLNMEKILLVFGEDPEIAHAAQAYVLWVIPILFLYSCLLPIIKFCQTQHAVFLLMICSAITLCVHVPLCWLVIDKLNVGYKGAAIAANISLGLNACLIVLSIRSSSKFEKTFPKFSKEVLQDFGEFFKLAIPSAIMMWLVGGPSILLFSPILRRVMAVSVYSFAADWTFLYIHLHPLTRALYRVMTMNAMVYCLINALILEHWSYEVLTLLAGLLPNSKLEISSFAICMGLLSLANMIAMALSVTVSVRVSNELGAGRPSSARSSVAVSVGIGLVEGILMACLLYSVRNVWGYAFSNDQEVVDRVAGTAPYLAVLVFIYSFQGVLSGVVRGIGWQRIGAFANLGAYYGVGLPVALSLMYVFHFDGRGLWIGMGCGMLTQTIALVVIILFTNWENLAREALIRTHSFISRSPSGAPLLTDDKSYKAEEQNIDEEATAWQQPSSAA